MRTAFTPGVYVINPLHPEWGMGQVQSAVGDRVTVNFEHAGKMPINIAVVPLQTAELGQSGPARGD